MNYNLEKNICFPTSVYSVVREDFLDTIKQVSKKHMTKIDNYVNMSKNFYDDPDVSDFSNAILHVSWKILKDQGYYMEDKETYFTEMWTQEHYKHSLMEQHTHKFGSQIVGFYFLETPDNCSKLLIHDPRPAKMIMGLDEVDEKQATEASDVVNFKPQPGLMIFTNGWLPHSFSRHENEEPIKFVHFNVGVSHTHNNIPLAEVI
jgi:uncharacterized protein (TIGR02466 family)